MMMSMMTIMMVDQPPSRRRWDVATLSSGYVDQDLISFLPFPPLDDTLH